MSTLRCRARPEVLYHQIIEPELGDKLTFGYVPKYFLKELFAGYSKLIPEWDSYPAQCLFGFDFGGEYDQTKSFEFFLPEVVLYENMCLAYNLAVLSKYEARPGSIDKIRRKTFNLHLHTAVLSAFYFVEAYLNGIAFDFYFRMKGDKELSQEETDKLGEYDSQRGRERWVSFRDKMLQYPKIVLGGLKDPPLTEDNCEEMRILVSEARALRDSLVHNSPKFELEVVDGKRQLIGRKVRSIIDVKLQDVTMIVDAAVGYIKKLDALLQTHGHRRKGDWLFERDEKGMFPAKTFE
ncbi:MAG: hypothetical protein WBB89_00395 [Candidatus Acidiferrum sp.]